MARVKRAVNAHKKRREVLEQASGYRGQRSRLYRKAKARNSRHADDELSAYADDSTETMIDTAVETAIGTETDEATTVADIDEAIEAPEADQA